MGAVQNVAKAGVLITLTNSQDVQTVLNGTQVRLKSEVRFDMAEENGLPALSNMAGVAVHKFIWLDIQSIQLKENQGQKVVRVVTSAGTRDIPVG